jgi:hypothetical protein
MDLTHQILVHRSPLLYTFCTHTQKSFNPQNLTNQKTVWERQQQEKQEARRIKERNDQLRSERDDEELAIARGDTLKLGWMYNAPPDLQGPQKTHDSNDNEDEDDNDQKLAAVQDTARNALVQRQPGDDDAAAAFRLMLAAPPPPADDDDDNYDALDTSEAATDSAQASYRGMGLQGSSVDADKKGPDARSSLEKAVGRRNDSSGLTLDEQVQRFPTLANAPRAKGMTSTDIGVSFKPLGTQIRNVRCLACQKWGHSKGDRECEKEWDPFAGRPPPLTAASKQRKEDPDVSQEKAVKDHRRDSSDSDDSDSSDDSRHERKRKRREKHHKSKRRKESKHRRRSRSEDSADDRDRYQREKSHKRSKRGSKHGERMESKRSI